MIMIGIFAALAVIGLRFYAADMRLSPDGEIYRAAARGERVPRPFHLRWLMPTLVGESPVRWGLVGIASLVVSVFAIAWYGMGLGLNLTQAGFASLLFAALPMNNTNIWLPVLVDAPAMALTAISAALAVHGYVVAAVLIAILGATVKEHVPVFAALAAMNPWLLVALAVVALRWATHRPAPPTHRGHSHPFAFALESHRARWLDITKMVLPWGACLAALFGVNPAVVLSLFVAYGMLLVAGDSTRVYQWACLPVCVAAAAVIPGWLMVAAGVYHVWNPFHGDV